MPDGDLFLVDAEAFNKGLRKLNSELQKETRRRMAGIARRERDRIRADFKVGPAKGGHAYRAVTSGTSGLIPTLKLRRRASKYPYVGWLVFGGRRRRYYRSSGTYRVDRKARRAPDDGFWFYPGVARARRDATDEIYEALQEARRRAGI